MHRSTGEPRLLVVTPDFPPAFGGIQRLVERLVENMSRFSTRVVTLEASDARAFDAAFATQVVRAGRSSVRGATSLSLNAAAAREARRFRPQVVLAAHIVAAPAAALIQRIAGSRYVQYLHANELAERPRLAGFAVRHAAVSIAVSTHTQELAVAAGADPQRLHRIPPGVDLPAGRRAQRDQDPIIATVARLADRRKGHDVIARALPQIRAAVPGVRWVVIGDGPLRAELEDLTRAGGVADITVYAGAVPDAERDEWLDRASLFVMPSRPPEGGRGGEGFGIAYLEAATHELPAVAGNVGGALDAVIDGGTGLLVDPTDSDAVARAVIAVLSDAQLAGRLGRAAAARAQDFAWPRIADDVERLLLSMDYA